VIRNKLTDVQVKNVIDTIFQNMFGLCLWEQNPPSIYFAVSTYSEPVYGFLLSHDLFLDGSGLKKGSLAEVVGSNPT
jgi:hypothetical protein